MADMSPSAVTERLRLMDQLWELSVKLMNSKLVSTSDGVADTEIEPASDADDGTSQNRKR
ncbi:MAG: hypothetical protein ABI481_09390 [Pyrinomonadaceae bacterium]